MTTNLVPGSREAGLTSADAARLLAAVGPNRLPDPPRRGVGSRLVEQLRDPMILLLLGAAALTTYLRDWPNTAIIAAVVVFNTTVGLIQQVRAERAMAALRQLVAPVACVVRDGVLVPLPAVEVVPGDVAMLAAGDVVPADGTLVEVHDLQVDESRVTGESLPVAPWLRTVTARSWSRAPVRRAGSAGSPPCSRAPHRGGRRCSAGCHG
jgi:P-type Ca2+ transporter type 2C